MEPTASPVTQFYAGKVVFMTGGTGFMGKVLIEKLLSSCPDIKQIYVLIRSKKGEDKNKRLAKIKEGRAFQALKKRYPARLDKLQALEGDIELPDLGLSAADRLRLREVNIVFNVAATLNFNEEIRKSLTINVLATKALLELCVTMDDLKAFVHVSTAYSNCDRELTEERVYPPPCDLRQLLHECDRCVSEQDVEDLTRRVLGKRPNTYTLTKAMAENVIEEYKSKFPIAIVRPSIVTAALRTPQPGWVDCRTGPTGLMMLIGSGLLRIAIGSRDIVIDLVPVDLVDNAILVIGWKTSILGAVEPAVYHVTSGRSNPVYMGQLLDCMLASSKENPQDQVVWYPSIRFTTNRFLFGVGNFLMHTVPAHVHDLLLPSTGKDSFVRLYSNIRKATDAMEVFMSNSYHFADGNLRNLIGEMSEQDRTTFHCDATEVAWEPYIAQYMLGARKYLLGQSDQTIPQARERMRGLSFKHTALKLAAAGVAYYLAVSFSTPYIMGRF